MIVVIICTFDIKVNTNNYTTNTRHKQLYKYSQYLFPHLPHFASSVLSLNSALHFVFTDYSLQFFDFLSVIYSLVDLLFSCSRVFFFFVCSSSSFLSIPQLFLTALIIRSMFIFLFVVCSLFGLLSIVYNTSYCLQVLSSSPALQFFFFGTSDCL